MLKKLMNQKGFTLVELLIVIAVIGILAVAVLAALDPIEQLKKSRDTGRLSDAREMYNAMTRYYASFNCYPDERNYGATSVCTSAALALDNTGGTPDPFMQSLNQLTTSGELKTSFSSKQSVSRGQLFIYHDANGSLSVCFHPESKAGMSGGIGPLFGTAGSAPTINGTCNTATPYDADAPTWGYQGCAVCIQ